MSGVQSPEETIRCAACDYILSWADKQITFNEYTAYARYSGLLVSQESKGILVL